jgi:aldehyde:ferredoxin oxidoreductase
VPMHDPKVSRGFAATYWLDATPARHTQGHEEQMPSGFKMPSYDPKSWQGRGPIHKIGSNLVHIVNCTGLCLFTMDVSSINDIIGFLNAATGWNCSIEELEKTGERIANLRHIFNLREGQLPHLRHIPDVIRSNPNAKTPPLAGLRVDFETAGHDWMNEMKWDLSTGKPDRNRLRDLGIEEYAV